MGQSDARGYTSSYKQRTSQKQFDTTSIHGTIKIPGFYNITMTFDRPSQEFPTTAIKEFRVPQVNS